MTPSAVASPLTLQSLFRWQCLGITTVLILGRKSIATSGSGTGRESDLDRAEHQHDVRALTAAYALDPMGNGGPLSTEVLERLIPGLRAHPTTLIFLAYRNGQAVGLATCFRGFSTLAARPLINISDLATLPEFRGRGFGRQLLAAVETKAQALGCCRVTLEVQENRQSARRMYEAHGFSQAGYGPTTGGSLYYWKSL